MVRRFTWLDGFLCGFLPLHELPFLGFRLGKPMLNPSHLLWIFNFDSSFFFSFFISFLLIFLFLFHFFISFFYFFLLLLTPLRGSISSLHQNWSTLEVHQHPFQLGSMPHWRKLCSPHTGLANLVPTSLWDLIDLAKFVSRPDLLL